MTAQHLSANLRLLSHRELSAANDRHRSFAVIAPRPPIGGRNAAAALIRREGGSARKTGIELPCEPRFSAGQAFAKIKVRSKPIPATRSNFQTAAVRIGLYKLPEIHVILGHRIDIVRSGSTETTLRRGPQSRCSTPSPLGKIGRHMVWCFSRAPGRA